MPDDDPGDSVRGEATHLRAVLADANLRFPERPKVVDDVLIFTMPDGLGVQIRGVIEPLIIRGTQAAHAVDYISTASKRGLKLAEILRDAPSTLSENSILSTFLLLHSKGLIVDSSTNSSIAPYEVPKLPPHIRSALFWSRYIGISGSCPSAATVTRSLASHSILLVGNGLFAALLLEALVRSGFLDIMVLNWQNCDIVRASFDRLKWFLNQTRYFIVESRADFRNLDVSAIQPDLVVTALRGASVQVFTDINQLCLRNRWPWLVGQETPEQFEVGPFVNPFDTACFTCMELRRRGVAPFPIEEKLFQDYLDSRTNSSDLQHGLSGECTASSLLPVGILAMECIRIATTVSLPMLTNSSMSIRAIDGLITKHRILRVPHCPDCQSG
jgi:bacteriocin biosynthesis cyclodehydratase domain-containing protein